MTNTSRLEDAENFISYFIGQHLHTLASQDIPNLVRQKFYNMLIDDYHFQDGDFDELIKSLEESYAVEMSEGVSLIDYIVLHDEEWYKKREIKWDYWKDYEKYLNDQGWPIRVIAAMDSVTNKILGLLEDPSTNGEWCRKGLVIGHVQSGKTANYIGLLSKAADAGYKFIIVIAGIHNNLRTQTQERIDEGFIGRDSRTKEPIGVGLYSQRARPMTVTTAESDFNKNLAQRIGMDLTSLNNTFILVVKKNANTLNSLYTWLKKFNIPHEDEKITDIPMLLIDDESDHASINTNKTELDPTRINKEIRKILNLFRKRCYVGYTATPFANIFIDPDSDDEMLGSDIFPEDFIYCLDAPSNYFGIEKIFLNDLNDETDTLPYFIKEINDAENYIPLSHKKDVIIDDLPQSLEKAIRLFILSRAIRNLRGQEKKHCSMLINASRFVDVQRDIKHLTQVYINELRNAIRFNYKLPLEKAFNDDLIYKLHEDFISEYSETDVEWKSVLEALNNAVSDTKVVLVNSRSDENLLYKAYAKEGNALTAIAVGGLSLSRGLTIEGLTISYVYRSSKMYDTLMQMGRWFGYRPDYEDLCRIFMSNDSYSWYRHIAEATEELRTQIKRMRRENKRPKDFGLYVRAHPDTLIVTAVNKMRHTEKRNLRVSYDGKLKETHIIPASESKNNNNRILFKEFYEELSSFNDPHKDNTNSYLFRDIDSDRIHSFILDFSFHDYLFDLKEYIPEFIQKISSIFPIWDVTFKSLVGKTPESGYMIAAQERNIGHEPSPSDSELRIPKVPPLESGWYTGNKDRFSGNSMFTIGLNETQLYEAQKLAEDLGRRNPIYQDYTNVRNKPILMLHILNLIDRDRDNEPVLSLAPALSISFPNMSELKTVEYVVGKVWLKQFEREQADAPIEEDDYELEQ